jgi:hypothetical protein
MRALLPSLSALLLLLLLATPSLAASPLGVDFCSECSLYGSGPFCLNNCSDCNSVTEFCITDLPCGDDCWSGGKVACCSKRLFPRMEDIPFGQSRLFSAMVRDNRVYVDALTFQVVPFTECLWTRFSTLSPFTVHACVVECKFTLSCYATCLGYPTGIVAAEATVCALRDGPPPDVLIAADPASSQPQDGQCPHSDPDAPAY